MRKCIPNGADRKMYRNNLYKCYLSQRVNKESSSMMIKSQARKKDRHIKKQEEMTEQPADGRRQPGRLTRKQENSKRASECILTKAAKLKSL